VIPKHATLIHKEAQHAVDRLHKLVHVFVVFVMEARYLVAQVAFDVSIRPKYQPVLRIFDGFPPCARVIAFDNPFLQTEIKYAVLSILTFDYFIVSFLFVVI